jgi:tetratricopeptide (TPR) repeat protein
VLPNLNGAGSTSGGTVRKAPSHHARRASAQHRAVARPGLPSKPASWFVDQLAPDSDIDPSCLAIVTSRDALAGLVARHGATRVELDRLPLDDAISLLRALIGDRVDGERGPAETLAEQCARLPLALRVAAELAAHRAGTPLAAAVSAVFSWSYHHLPSETGRLFRLLSLHPGADVDQYAAAALGGTTVEPARRALDLLTRSHMVHVATPGRYSMHDLLRAYAGELCVATHAEAERQSALVRLFDHYVATALTAMDTLFPAERHRRPAVPASDVPVSPVADASAARAWLDAERGNLVSVCGHAAGQGRPRYTVWLARTLYRYLDLGGHATDAVAVHTLARQAAAGLGDHAAEAQALVDLGATFGRWSRLEAAADHLRQAIAVLDRVQDWGAQARALHNLGSVCWRQGRFGEAAEFGERAGVLFRRAGDLYGETIALINLGKIYASLGQYRRASELFEEGVAIAREQGDAESVAHAIGNLAEFYVLQGQLDHAAACIKEALPLHHCTGSRIGEAPARSSLGEIYSLQDRMDEAVEQLEYAQELFRAASHHFGEALIDATFGEVRRRQGRHAEAVVHFRRAVDMFVENGDRGNHAKARNGLAATLTASGRPDVAREEHAVALALATETGDRLNEALAYAGLGDAAAAMSDTDTARHHWRLALAVFTDLDLPQADGVRRRLAALGERPLPGAGNPARPE